MEVSKPLPITEKIERAASVTPVTPKPVCDHTGYAIVHHRANSVRGASPLVSGRCMLCGAEAKNIDENGAITEWHPSPVTAA